MYARLLYFYLGYIALKRVLVSMILLNFIRPTSSSLMPIDSNIASKSLLIAWPIIGLPLLI